MNMQHSALRRREFLGAGLAAAALSACSPVTVASGGPSPAPAIGPQSLDRLARRSGRRFGSAVAWGAQGADRASFANPAYAAIIDRECSLVVPENELKWAWIRPSATGFDFTQFDAIVAQAIGRGLKVRGHTLLWVPEKWSPKWLVEHDFGARPAQAAANMLTEHVRTVVRRYGTKIYSYDVVNEAIDPETGAIRDTVLTRAMGGEAALDLMFHVAKAEAPHAELVYNDYMSWERTPEDIIHMRGVLRLLEGFRKRGTPVHALGIQSHIRLLKHAPVADIVRESEGPWRQFLDAVVAMGYDLVITEFDVNDKTAPDDIIVRDQMVAEYSKAYLDVMLAYPQLRDILAWGMVDRYTWLTDFDPRADKSIKRGTPYDSQFRAKPLRDAIAAAFLSANVNATAAPNA